MSPESAESADVTVCIPAWQAAAFIDRTLDCARGQSYRHLRILVSVDRGDDDTAAICRRHAAADPRIEVIEQRRRLGWSENANALLSRVATEFFFLYFHDDIIAPTYVEALRNALLADPTATSAHCDLERFGDETGIDPGNHYHGDAGNRLLAFLAGPVKGTPLRSMTRRAVLAQGLCFPEIGEAGFWRCHPYLLTLLAAGPALRVPEVLYRRWFRAGSMTRSWEVASTDALIDGQSASARLCRAIIDDASTGASRLAVLRHALCLFYLLWTRREELRLGRDSPLDPALIHRDFTRDRTAPPDLEFLPEEQRIWLTDTATQVRALESRFPAHAAP
jgi:hypothetical protein